MELDKQRYLIRKINPISDRLYVLRNERLSFELPLLAPEYDALMVKRDVYGAVCEDLETNEIVGHLIFECSRYKLVLQNFLVIPEHARRGIGRAFVKHAMDYMSYSEIGRMTCLASEANTPAHHFLLACGLHAVRVVKEPFLDRGISGDAYMFVFRFPAQEKDVAT